MNPHAGRKRCSSHLFIGKLRIRCEHKDGHGSNRLAEREHFGTVGARLLSEKGEASTVRALVRWFEPAAAEEAPMR